MNKTSGPTISERSRIAIFIAAYILSAGPLILFSIFPEGRVWGFNLLAYFPATVIYTFIAALLLVPAITLYADYADRTVGLKDSENSSTQSNGFVWFTIVFTALSVMLFYLFRATTHFDGDGYAVLSNLASAKPIVKLRNYGALVAQFGLYRLLGKTGPEAALFVYQVISYFSGALFLVLSSLTAVIVFGRFRERVLFVAGMAVGGYALMFFGYAENYALFVVAIALYLYAGMRITYKGTSRWLILPANLLALFFHVFGLMLLPATVYILARKSRFAHRISSSKRSSQVLLAFLLIASLVGGFLYLFYSNYFFRFAFLPIIADRFTVSGYTMFSGKHLLDLVNLLFVLCPGLLVIVSMLSFRKSRPTADAGLVFLTIVALCVLITVLIFDPKLGMARDWDLFAFAGVPVNMMLLMMVLRLKSTPKTVLTGLVLTVVLGTAFMAARVAIKTDDMVAMQRLRTYTPLDPIRNDKNGLLISKYYFDHDDTLRGYQEDSLWDGSKKDFLMIAYSKALFDSGRVQLAMSAYRQAIAINPFNPASYNNLGQCFIEYRQLDSAKEYLLIAQGMRPGDSYVLNNLGWIAYQHHENRKAEKLWLKAIDAESTFLAPHQLLLQLYQAERDRDKYLDELLKLVRYPDAPPERLTEAAAYFCRVNRLAEARRLLAKARANGLDSVGYSRFLNQHPELTQNP